MSPKLTKSSGAIIDMSVQCKVFMGCIPKSSGVDSCGRSARYTPFAHSSPELALMSSDRMSNQAHTAHSF